MAGVGYVNPFFPERIKLENQPLGKDFISTVSTDPVRSDLAHPFRASSQQ